MTSSIQKFKSSFKYDPAKQNSFDVNIILPPNLPSLGVTSRDLTFKCQMAELPGRTMATIEQKTYGPVGKFPYMTMFNDIDLTFIIEDNNLSVCTDTRKAWGLKKLTYENFQSKKIIYYKYKNKYPHAGAGKRVQF